MIFLSNAMLTLFQDCLAVLTFSATCEVSMMFDVILCVQRSGCAWYHLCKTGFAQYCPKKISKYVTCYCRADTSENAHSCLLRLEIPQQSP